MRHSDRLLIRNLRDKFTTHQLVVTKADTGNALVIMQRELYHSKVVRVIEDMGSVEGCRVENGSDNLEVGNMFCHVF